MHTLKYFLFLNSLAKKFGRKLGEHRHYFFLLKCFWFSEIYDLRWNFFFEGQGKTYCVNRKIFSFEISEKNSKEKYKRSRTEIFLFSTVWLHSKSYHWFSLDRWTQKSISENLTLIHIIINFLIERRKFSEVELCKEVQLASVSGHYWNAMDPTIETFDIFSHSFLKKLTILCWCLNKAILFSFIFCKKIVFNCIFDGEIGFLESLKNTFNWIR